MSKPTAPLILIADDDPQFLRLMEHHLHAWSYRVDAATDKGQLLRKLAGAVPDLLLMDVRFGEHDGVEVLRQVLAERPALRVAMLTAFGSIDNAIAAIKLGAVDYLTKPVDMNRLKSVVVSALDRRPSDETPRRPARSGLAAFLQPVPPPADPPPGPKRPILGTSRAIRNIRGMIDRVAATDATVLVLGESGTGKELVARAVHELSGRRDGPFVAVNVAALPRELVESTLFGHAKGAFTGADQMQRGCCEVADGGTLFLDEIGEMEVGLQAKLLRFLQERSFNRVGQSSPISVDMRIVTATNRDPLEQVRRGLMREDLYYRLNVVPIVLPPLRDRAEDVPVLAKHLLERACSRGRRDACAFTDDALVELSRYSWPGNVRELENLVERLAIMTPGTSIEAESVRPHLVAAGAARPAFEGLNGDDPLREIDRIEKDAIVNALTAARGNVREAARNLGLGQATVYRKIKKYQITTV